MISLIFALAFSFSRVAWRVAATHLSRLLSRHWESQGETLHQHLRIPAKSSWVSGETPVNVLEHILDTLHIESIRKLLFAQVSTGLAHSATYGICYLHSAWCAAIGVTKQAFCKYKNLSHSSTHAKNRQDPVRRSQWTRTPFGSMPREFILLLVSVCLCMIHCSPDGNIDWDGSKSFMSVFPKESLLTMILRQTSTMDHDICIYCLINYLYLLSNHSNLHLKLEALAAKKLGTSATCALIRCTTFLAPNSYRAMSFCTRITPSWQWTMVHWEGNRSDGSAAGSPMGIRVALLDSTAILQPSDNYNGGHPKQSENYNSQSAQYGDKARKALTATFLAVRNTLTVCLTFMSSWHFSWCLVPRLAACTPQETPGQTKTIFTESSPPQGRQVKMFTGGMPAFVDMIARKFKAQRNTTVQSATAALLSSHLAGIGLTTNPVPVWTHKVAARCCTDFLTLHRFVPMPMLSPSFLATYVAFFRPWWKHTTCNTRGAHVTKHVAVCLGIVRTMTFQRKSAFNPI